MFKSSDTMVKYSTFPDPTNADGWWSQTDKRWYTKAEIVSTRAGIAGTYTNDGIPKPANLMVAKATKPSVTVTYKKNAKNVTGANISVTDAAGALTYTNASTDPVAKKFKVNKSTGRLTIPAGTPAGTYTMKVKVTAAGDAEYKKGTKTVSYKIVVKKAANPITIKAVARKARYVTLKNKAVTVIKPLSVSGAVGTKTYTRVTHSKYCTVNKSNGRVTIKKGTPKGTYTLKIKVTAAGNSNYKSGSKTVACKVIVK